MVDLHAGQFDARRAEEHLNAARDVFEAGEDDLGLAWAGFLEANMRWMRGHAALAAAAAQQAEDARPCRGGRPARRNHAELVVDGLSFGPASVAEALAAGQAHARRGERPGRQRLGPAVLGKLLAMQGDQDAARELVRAGVESSREAGQLIEAAGGVQTVAFVELHAGAPETAEDVLRASIAELDRLGNLSYRGTSALMLAHVLATRGAYEEAARWCAEVREILNEDDLADVIAADSLEGFLAAAAGSHDEGERLSGQAVELAATTDMYEWNGRVQRVARAHARARRQAAGGP